MGMHRDQARKAAGRARIAAAGLAAVGGVVLFAPFPKLDAAPASEPPRPPTTTPTPGPKTAAAFDPESAAGILRMVGPEARPAAPVEPLPESDTVAGGSTTEEEREALPEPTGGPELRYLGPIVGPRRTLAMVALDGQQHVVAVGERVDGKTVREVTPTQVVLDDADGVEYVVAMAPRVLDWAMDTPAPRGLQSKRFLGPAGKAGAVGENANARDAEFAMPDVELKRQMEARQIEARRLEQERGGSESNEANAPARPRPSVPGASTPRPPTSTRGTTTATPARTPPSRTPVPANTKPAEKKVGNQV